MDFQEMMGLLESRKRNLKTLSVATADENGKPNSAHKMLIDVILPDQIYLVEYRFTQSYGNLVKNPFLSISFMDDSDFIGFKFTGSCKVLELGEALDQMKARWEEKLVSYEAGRILQRMRGQYSARSAENALPKDFVVVKLTVCEASLIRPDYILRTHSIMPDFEK